MNDRTRDNDYLLDWWGYLEEKQATDQSTENLQTLSKVLLFAAVLFLSLVVINWLAEVAGAISPSTCRIIDIDPGTFLQDSAGSGVLVAKDAEFGYVLTAKHVIENKIKGHRFLVLFPKSERVFAFPVRKCRADWREAGPDLALLKIDPPVEIAPRPVSWRKPGDGEKVWQSGFGNWEHKPIEFWMRVLPRLRVVGESTILTGDETLLMTDKPARSGDSGGPVIDSEGRVLGIVTAANDTTGYHILLEGQEWLKQELPPQEHSILVR